MERRLYTPSEPQRIIIQHETEWARCGVFAGMGMGKTSSTLTHLERLYHLGIETQPTLICAPLRVAASVWPSEVRKWAHLSTLDVVPILGTPSQREHALRQDSPLFTINFENLPWLADYFAKHRKRWPFRTIVADESTRLKSMRLSEQVSKKGVKYLRASGGSVRAAALAKIAYGTVSRWINLTGTPAPKGLLDLWAQLWFLDGGARLGRTFTAFEGRWFRYRRGNPHQQGGKRMELEPLPHAAQQIQNQIDDICVSLDPADYFDIQKPIFKTLYIDLPPKARELYRQMEKKLYIEIQGSPVEAANSGIKSMKLLQLANGAVYIDEEHHWKEVHAEKLKALDSVIAEANGMPVLVSYHFRSDLERLLEAFPKGKHLDDDPKTIDAWNAGEIPILFAHPASTGHGLNLQDGGNILVFFGHWWALENFLQIIERIGPMRQLQAGYRRAVFVYFIVARATSDEDVIVRLAKRQSVQQALMDGLKYREATHDRSREDEIADALTAMSLEND